MEDSYIINGGKRLSGTVEISGAKNAALKMMIASLLFEEKVTLHNVPRIADVSELINLINSLGAKARFIAENTVEIDPRDLSINRVDLLYGSKIRVSFMLFAPLLMKFRHCFVPNPGGCRIGARPIDRIVFGMKTLGVEVDYDSQTGYYEARMDKSVRGKYRFEKPTHTGTELLILLSLIGSETVQIENAAQEPEIDNLIEFLNESGAKILKDGAKITIYGVKKLSFKKPFAVMQDRNEAVTFSSLVLSTGGSVEIQKISPSLIEPYLKKLKDAGVNLNIEKTGFATANSGLIKAVNIETSPHPGFMTDWQPNWAVLMTQAEGTSIIHERVFENRFSYVEELRKLGAEIEYVKIPVKNPIEYFFFNFDPNKVYNQAIRIRGVQKLHGGALNILDLRAGATLAIAALTAEGESIINGVSILERGYENFVEKVKNLGGEIKKI